MVELAPRITVAEAASSANSNDRNVAFTGTVQIRMMRSEIFISDDPNFQCEALWALTNNLLQWQHNTDRGSDQIPNVDVCEQAARALGNICGDGIARRDYVMQLGFFPALLKAPDYPIK
ncbi:hypothetical protein Pelo_4114 [Pelomyxa schiedti]|nr:hypothetical protein Pelo_4114 [Pelomyxa schiedti]